MEEERGQEIRPADVPETPADTVGPLSAEEELDQPSSAVQESRKEIDQLMEQLQRAQADFINYKRRSQEEREEQQKHANSRLILKLLPTLDEFTLAIDHADTSGAENSWLEGIKLINRKLQSLLESEKVTRIEAQGREFDPFEHEAIGYQESDYHQEGQILTVVRDGYKLHGRVIRPATVILARRPDPKEKESSPSNKKETDDA